MTMNTAVLKPSRNGRGPDKDEIKQAAAGRWPQILAEVGGIPPAHLDGQHHECYRCGGKDRFRLIDEDAGAVLCNQCFSGGNGDGLAAVAWARGVEFGDACDLVGEYLGLCGSNGAHNTVASTEASQEADAADADADADLEATRRRLDGLAASAKPTADRVLHDVCTAKRMPVKQAKLYGGRVVLNGMSSTVVWPLYAADGTQSGSFTICWQPKDADEAKGKITGHWGWFLPHHDDGTPRLPARKEAWLMMEGVKKTAAAASLGYLVVGTPSNFINDKLAPLMQGVNVTNVPDCDAPGRDGAAKSAKLLGGIAKSVRIASLPDEGGTVKDVRDLLEIERGAEIFAEAVAAAEVVKAPATVQVVSAGEFLAMDIPEDYIVDHCFISGEPMVIGGPMKSLKTSLMIDLAVAIGSGVPFLDDSRFAAKQRCVAVISGESGKRSIQGTLRRIGAAKGIQPAMGKTYWGFDLPCLGSEDGVDALVEMIEERGVEVAFIDPVYLSLIGMETANVNPANLFAIGPLLKRIVSRCLNVGCTPALVHHFNRGAREQEKYGPPTLDNLSMAGFAEFARQWILVNRRSRYTEDGNHELWLSVGGSAGHSGLYAIDVAEGSIDDPGGRVWALSLRSGREAYEADRAAKETKRQEKQAAEKAAKLEADRKAAVQALIRFPEGATKNAIRMEIGCNGQRINEIFAQLLEEGAIQEAKVPSGNATRDGFKVVLGEC